MTTGTKIAWILCAIATVLLVVWLVKDQFTWLGAAFVIVLPAYFLFKKDLHSPSKTRS